MFKPHQLGLITLIPLLHAGCVSLDPTTDIGRAAELVSERSDAEANWSTPWNEPASIWDGRVPLSADVAVHLALQSNRQIRQSVETITEARADLVQAHLLPNPVINFTLGLPTDGLGGTPMTASLIQQLAWLWRRPATIDAADAQLEARILSVSDAALSLAAKTRRAHARVVLAERALQLQQDNLEPIGRSLELLQTRFDVGEASRLDVNRVELDLFRAEVDLTDRERALAIAKRQLLELIGQADASTDWTSDGQLPEVDWLAHSHDEQTLIDLTLEQRLDVAAADARVQSMMASLDLREGQSLPEISGGVGYRQNYADRPAIFPSVSVTPKLLDDNSAAVAKAASRLEQARIEADRVRQAAVSETRKSWIAYQSQQHVVAAFEEDIVELAEQNLELANQSFTIGESDLTVLLESQRQLTNVRLALTDRQAAAVEQLIELERAAGGSLDRQPTQSASRQPQAPQLEATR